MHAFEGLQEAWQIQVEELMQRSSWSSRRCSFPFRTGATISQGGASSRGSSNGAAQEVVVVAMAVAVTERAKMTSH